MRKSRHARTIRVPKQKVVLVTIREERMRPMTEERRTRQSVLRRRKKEQK